MRTFAVRLNPDPRKGPWYSKYPTQREYDRIFKEAAMNGFHEAVNYLDEDGLVRGYLPPRHLRALRDGEPFVLITVTASGAQKDGDVIVGVQANCQYLGPGDGEGLSRLGGPHNAADITFHYSCPSRLSLLFTRPLQGARALLLARSQNWNQGPTKELTKADIAVQVIEEGIHAGNVDKSRARAVLKALNGSQGIRVDGIGEEMDGTEGTVSKRMVKHRKREAKLRREKIRATLAAYGRLVCEAPNCGFDFQHRYGPLGFGYAEVHHRVPLADLDAAGAQTRLQDLAVVCANCHRMIHRNGECRPLDGLVKKEKKGN